MTTLTHYFIVLFSTIIIADILHALCLFFISRINAEYNDQQGLALKELPIYLCRQTGWISILLHKKSPLEQPLLKKISFIFIALLFVTAAYYQFMGQDVIALCAALLFGAILLSQSWVDLETFILPDTYSYTLIISGLVVGYNEIFTSFKLSLVGAILGFGVFWSINASYKLLRNKQGMGGGDFKLLAGIGAYTGAEYLPMVILLSSIFAVVAAFSTAPFNKATLSKKLPFGPFLALAGALALLYGEAYNNFIYNDLFY